MYQCFHCLQYSVGWTADFDLEEWEGEGEGLVHVCHCANCGAEITYIIRFDEEGDDEVNSL
jgi:hypothetical protein